MRKIFFVFSLLVLVAGCKDEEVQLSEADQLQKDVETIDQWLTKHGITALTDPSGLRYVITTMGTGAKPKLTNKVLVKYAGKILVLKEGITPANSIVFDQSTAGIAYILAEFVQGWQIGFQLLPKGTKATLYIPSGLAYGKYGYGSIPPNSNMFFDVELIDVK